MNPTPQYKNVVNGTIHANGNVHIGDIIYHNNGLEIKIPTLLTNNIPSDADHIIGRDTELATISEYLTQNKPTILVNGIGGIGKTSVAAKYVATCGHQYKHIAWLTVQSSVAEAFTNDIVLLKSLHIEQDIQQLIETQRLTDAFKLVLHKLNTLEKTLVILDNANSAEDLITHKSLFDTAKCHYLITSRTQPQEWTIIEIDHLPPDEAVNLFRKLAPSVSATDEDLKSLLSKLFYHTLLIELVAKTVKNAGFSFEELQKMIENKFIHDAQLNEDIVSTGKHGENYDTKRAKIEEYIWLIFSNVKGLSDDAKQILKGMALLPVATPFDRAFLKEHLALFEVHDIVPNLLLLMEWGWLQKEVKGFKMHPLVADLIIKNLQVDVLFASDYIDKVISVMYYDNADPDDSLFEKKIFEPFSERLLKLFVDSKTTIIAKLLSCNSLYNAEFSIYEKAIQYGEMALTIVENLPLYEESFLSQCQGNLAKVYTDIGLHNEAISLLKKSIVNAEKFLGKYHEEVITLQCNLAVAYYHAKNYKDAIHLLDFAIRHRQKNSKANNAIIAFRQSNLAVIYKDLGQYEKAAELLEETLKNITCIYGLKHHHIATAKSNLGLIYSNLGRYKEAILLLQDAIKLHEEWYGTEHLSVATDLNNLACIYKDLNKHEEAQLLWRKSYKIRVKIFGEDHIQTQKIKQMLIPNPPPKQSYFYRLGQWLSNVKKLFYKE